VSSASPGANGDEKEAADVEEMDVDIQLDNDAGQAQQQEEKPQQQEQDEQTEVERKPSPKWFVAGTKTKKAPWCSSSLAAKKEQWRHIRDTPLLVSCWTNFTFMNFLKKCGSGGRGFKQIYVNLKHYQKPKTKSKRILPLIFL
jgi:hypothetical protein